MQRIATDAGALAWLFAFLAISTNTVEAFADPDGTAWTTLKFVVSALFTVFLVIAVGGWMLKRRRAQFASRFTNRS